MRKIGTILVPNDGILVDYLFRHKQWAECIMLHSQSFNPCSAGLSIQTLSSLIISSFILCFNPCSAGLSIQTCTSYKCHGFWFTFQSLFCWIIYSDSRIHISPGHIPSSFNPCSAGLSIQTTKKVSTLEIGLISFNPCSAGLSIQTPIVYSPYFTSDSFNPCSAGLSIQTWISILR